MDGWDGVEAVESREREIMEPLSNFIFGGQSRCGSENEIEGFGFGRA